MVFQYPELLRNRVETAVKEDEVKGILTISAAGYAAAYESK